MAANRTPLFGTRQGIVLVGALLGLGGALLHYLGNPANMGICVACFERDIAGALGLHRAGVVQYLRPEIPAFCLGAFIAALLSGEFRARAGSASLVHFVLGAFATIGALVFLGCPWRALFRLAAGDLNAVVGMVGLSLGVGIGVLFLRKGYTLGRNHETRAFAGLVFPLLMVGLVVLCLVQPSFLAVSTRGPGAMHAAVGVSLGIGLAVGILAQRSRFCTMAAIRDVFMMRNLHLLSGVAVLVATALVANLVLGQFGFGLTRQPIAHSNHLWNFLGMVLCGLCFAMAGGCPGRQLFLAGEGRVDSGIFVLGMVVGGGLAHNFLLTAGPDKVVEGVLKVGGPGPNGQIAVVAGILFCLVLGFTMRERLEWEY